MRWVILLIAAVSAVPAIAGPLSTTFDGSTLTLKFGDGSDWFHAFSSRDQGLLHYTDENSERFYGSQGTPLLTDDGDPVPANNILVLDVDMGGGRDGFLNPAFTVHDFAFIRGGSGDDVLQTPSGQRKAFVFGEDGDDQFIASHTTNNYVWGGDGDDDLHASFAGVDYLDGGSGRNSSGSYNTSTTTFVHHPGAEDFIFSNGGDSNYILTPGTKPSTLHIVDEGGFDTFDAGGHTFDVDGTTILSDTITGLFDGWDDIEVKTLPVAGGASTPEPATWLLALVAALMGWGIRRR